MLEFTLYAGNCTGNSANCLYPNKYVIKDKDSFLAAIKRDHVTAKFKNNYRAANNFQVSDNIPLDCDNDHTDNEKEWVTPLDVALAMPGVSFVAAFSRNHMKQKGSKSPRPRFHVFFPIPPMTSGAEYSALKKRIARFFPYFDLSALDCARFFFGSNDTDVEIYEGKTNILDFLEAHAFDEADAFAEFDAALEKVPEGQRNRTMSHIAGKLIKRYGNSSDSYALFLKEADKCNPPLPENELKVIWSSAAKFGRKVSLQEGYIPPEEYNSNYQLKPDDYSDVGQATVLAREYGGLIRFSPATDYIVYNNSFWEESKAKSQGVSQDLTERQLKEAEGEIKKAMDELMQNGGMDILATVGAKKAVQMFNKQQTHSFDKYQAALEYKKFAIRRRDSKYIAATLKEATPILEIEQNILDADEFFLNTPSFTYDLRRGLDSPLEHNPQHFITKQTSVDPSFEGSDIWESALNTFFQKDKALISYVQKMVGLSAIGKVYVEALIIAYGEGRNGKSTFWNVIARVLGSYSGNISADMLTVGCRRNVKPELAEAKGKRMLIAAELEEGNEVKYSKCKAALFYR